MGQLKGYGTLLSAPTCQEIKGRVGRWNGNGCSGQPWLTLRKARPLRGGGEGEGGDGAGAKWWLLQVRTGWETRWRQHGERLRNQLKKWLREVADTADKWFEERQKSKDRYKLGWRQPLLHFHRLQHYCRIKIWCNTSDLSSTYFRWNCWLNKGENIVSFLFSTIQHIWWGLFQQNPATTGRMSAKK